MNAILIERGKQRMRILAGLLLGAMAAPLAYAATWDVGDRKQLFIDHRFIAASEGIRLTVNPPQKLDVAAIAPDKQWEAFRFRFCNVVYDPADGLFKMWYTVLSGDEWTNETNSSYDKAHVCYATSKDGIHWTKPNLGLVDYQGSTSNNIVLQRGAEHVREIKSVKTVSVFLDPNARTPGERFKMLYAQKDRVTNKGDKYVAVSGDGLRWKFPNESATKNIHSDTQTVGFWDPRIAKYVTYMKTGVDKGVPFVEPIASNPPVIAPKPLRPSRAQGRIEMEDILKPWPEKEFRIVLAADEQDPEGSDIYTNGAYLYPYADSAYFFFPMVFHHFRDDELEGASNAEGVNDGQFAASRDGIHLMRYDRQPYIGRGLIGGHDAGMIWPQVPLLRVGNHLLQYYVTWPWTHGGFSALTPEVRANRELAWGKSAIHIARQRLDGFVSADASLSGGWIQTPPLHFAGDSLELNVNVSAMGEVRVEVQDEQGNPVPGFQLEECARLLMNDVAARVRWKGGDLSQLAGRVIRLKFAMMSAKLYAFQFRSTGSLSDLHVRQTSIGHTR